MDNANDNPPRPADAPRGTLFGIYRADGDELTFYDRELELRCIEAAPTLQHPRAGGDTSR